jgi:recombination protein RecR
MPESLKRLTELIAFLPGIGEKTATKLAFFLLKANASYLKELSERIAKVQSEIAECPRCFSLTDKNGRQCAICEDSSRNGNELCVVEDYLDLVAIERLGIYRGRYHVLGGSVSPMRGRMPSDLHAKELFERLAAEPVTELIIATNPNIEGEATALYIKENLRNGDLTVTRLSRGLPNAGYIEYADDLTLINAFRGRK